MTDAITIRQTEPHDLTAVLSLLRRASLPTEGVAEHLGRFFVAEVEGAIIGCVGLEVYGQTALLRSLAVTREFQNRGLGSQLAEHALHQAASLGLDNVLLLTTTAEGFFKQFGFTKITREDVPEQIRQSVEFRLNCCETAVCMRLHLKTNPPFKGGEDAF